MCGVVCCEYSERLWLKVWRAGAIRQSHAKSLAAVKFFDPMRLQIMMHSSEVCAQTLVPCWEPLSGTTCSSTALSPPPLLAASASSSILRSLPSLALPALQLPGCVSQLFPPNCSSPHVAAKPLIAPSPRTRPAASRCQLSPFRLVPASVP